MLFTDIQESIRKTFAEFADREIAPAAAEIDRLETFPVELFQKVGGLGFFSMRYPESAGGIGCDTVSYCLATMELARGSLSLAASCTMQSLMATWFLHRYGDADIISHYFTPALSGLKVGAICMTEPDAGSDLMSVNTTADVNGDGFLLNGSKTWVTSAPVADFFTVLARVRADDKLSLFFVPRTTSGVVVGRSIAKMGVCGSPTAEVSFSNVKLPPAYMLGARGTGGNSLREILTEIRLMTAALSVGVATAACEYATRYAGERSQFGKPIAAFQAIQLKIADMAVKVDTSRTYTLNVAAMADAGMQVGRQAMMAKLYASECAVEVCDIAGRILASYGYSREYPIERLIRDSRFTLIGGGTSEILKINIAKELRT